LRTQQIIGYETGAPNTVDPLAGSYYIESLTQQIEQQATAYLQKIDSLGGTLRAIEMGFIQQEIQNAAYDFQQSVDRLERVVVGVNRFQSEDEKSIAIQRIDEELERRQVERLRALRARRDPAPHQAAIRQVEEAARSGENLMPRIVNAVEAYATVGEISDAMRRVFGEHQETVVI
jgi:methylmalonyl-CoA mutase N-terminal domain/subunit